VSRPQPSTTVTLRRLSSPDRPLCSWPTMPARRRLAAGQSGSGVQPGAIADSVAFSAGRSYGRDWAGSLTANYTHSGGLLKQTAVIVGFPAGQFPFLYGGGNTNLAYGGAQVTRRISQTLSGYLSYNIQHQSIDNSLIFQNAFSGLSQTFGIGISFSPRSTRLGQF